MKEKRKRGISDERFDEMFRRYIREHQFRMNLLGELEFAKARNLTSPYDLAGMKRALQKRGLR